MLSCEICCLFFFCTFIYVISLCLKVLSPFKPLHGLVQALLDWFKSMKNTAV